MPAAAPAKCCCIGVISDTHGLLRPEALSVLQGSDLILHGGDVGKAEVLETLAAIAPVIAVRGNVDRDAWAEKLPRFETLEPASGLRIHLLHNIADLEPVAKSRCDVIVFGHSHKPRNEVEEGVLFFNPGSAGPRRFRLPVTVGRLWVDGDQVRGEIIPLPV